jgi:hypothetical protein
MKTANHTSRRGFLICALLLLMLRTTLFAQPNYKLLEESLSTSFTLLRSYTFDTGTDGWTAQTFIGYSLPEYGWQEGKLAMKGTSNDMLFGFWSNPLNDVVKERDHLYHIVFEVSTDVTARALVPQFRIRRTDSEYLQDDALLVTSLGQGGFSPLTSNCSYHLFYTACCGTQGGTQGLNWDMFSFFKHDHASATLFLDSAVISGAPLDSLATQTVVRIWDFQTGSEGWMSPDVFPPYWIWSPSPKISDVFVEAAATTGGASLQLKPRGPSCYGYWQSPFEVEISSNKMYLADFHLRSDQSNPSLVPEVFLSAVSQNWQCVVDKSLLCGWSQAKCCPLLTPDVYTIYFVPSPEWVGSHLGFLFQILYYGDNPNATVFLDKVVVKEMEMLVLPTPTPYAAARPSRWLFYE